MPRIVQLRRSQRCKHFAIKRFLNKIINTLTTNDSFNVQFIGLDQALQREADAQSQAYTSQDFLLGLDAVEAKKTAVFQGW